MAAGNLRILLLADTHLGFDLPRCPRIERRRRGADFFANFERALTPARRGQVDLVVHGGDLLFRSRVGAALVSRAVAPLLEVAERGVPVVVVPGNHERSSIPCRLLAVHPNLHLLDRARTLRLELGNLAVAVVGFPCERDRIRDRFGELLERSGWREVAAEVRVLCFHQTVEGARVGPSGYTFRYGADVIRGRDIPRGFAAVLAGHIHRHQVLTADLAGRSLAAPVLYPGSIERTSAAERFEPKGYMTLIVGPGERSGGELRSWRFHPVPTRPMIDLELSVAGLDRVKLTARLRQALADLDPDAVVRIRVRGAVSPEAGELLRAGTLRTLAPPTMTVEARWPGARRYLVRNVSK